MRIWDDANLANSSSKYWHIPGKIAEIQAPTRVFLSNLARFLQYNQVKYLYVAKAWNPGTQRTELPDEKRRPYPEL